MIFNTIVTILLLLLFGWGSSSIINYLADILPTTRRLGRPLCSNCQSALKWNNYIYCAPCQVCGKRTSVRHWIVQGLVPIIFLYLWFYGSSRMGFGLSILALSYFVLVFIIDFEYKAILYIEIIIGVIIGFITGIILHGFWATLIGSGVGFFIMYILYLLGKVYTRVFVSKRGGAVDDIALGFGDVNLSCVLGLFLGWSAITACLLLAIIIGGITSAAIIIYSKVKNQFQPFTAIPYAPFLIIGAAVLLFRPF